MDTVSVQSLPIYLSLPICSATLILVAIQAWKLRERCVVFLLLAIWLRYSLAEFHEFTYPPIMFGLSIMALSSVAVVFIGVVIVGGRKLLLSNLTPIYIMMLVVLASAVFNQTWFGALNATIKWLYLIVLALAAYVAIRRHGPDRCFSAVTVLFPGPIILQWLSVALGLRTINQDGSSAFIGGYQHQQGFSIIMLTFLFITCLSPRISLRAAYGRLAIAGAALALANYRTSLLAAALPATYLAISRLMGTLIQRQRPVAFLFLSVVTVFVFLGIANLAHDRFLDIGTAINKGVSLIQPPEYFTADEKQLFSGRAYLWSEYLGAYLRGDAGNILAGFGPESWVSRFPLYAHNTFISYLYEFGLFGFAAFSWILIAYFLMAAQTNTEERPALLSCHFGFFVLNLSTMPIWTLEGEILYALLLAHTWYLYSCKRIEVEFPHPAAARSLAHIR